MEKEKTIANNLFFTTDHEWIDFRETFAYTGVCGFKLIGYKEIHEIVFSNLEGYKKKGYVIAIIKYKDYAIEAHMPVDGLIMEVNNILLSADKNVLLKSPEKLGWIALIHPSDPSERLGLMQPKHYEMKTRMNKKI